jgi:glycosyltransferase involved in cell wall biosynthesis
MPKALVLYHYFHPDDVVSARHFSDLATGLASRGWDVTVLPCNRGCRDESQEFGAEEHWEGLTIRRVWRPAFRQASSLGRVLNTAWMLAAWSLASLRERPDILIVGTDPMFGVLVALPWKTLRPGTRIMHWCFDLHPEAAIADGMVRADHPLVRIMRPLLRGAYRRCDLIGSLGACMTGLLRRYDPKLRIDTYTPWALSEPIAPVSPDPKERAAMFGSAPLGLMYSGNFGKAHSFDTLLALARKLRPEAVPFVFSVRGNRVQELKDAVTPGDTNVSFAGFVPQQQLERRLGAADIHIVTLRPEYAGTVVPSKFQGALAAGRPILYAGPKDSAVAQWIESLGLGWTLTEDTLDEVAGKILDLRDRPETLQALKQRCFSVYQSQFSKRAILDRMDRDLRALVNQ